MAKDVFMAFTINWDGKENALVTKIGVSLPYGPEKNNGVKPSFLNVPPQKINDYKAIWDTGATVSVITKKIAQDLKLQPVSKTIVHTAGGTCTQDVYLVNIYLPNKVVMPFVRVTECEKLMAEADVLIGMDVISGGDFAVTNAEGKTTLSFRLPSIRKIDYVREAERIKEEATKKITSNQREEIRKKRKMQRQAKKIARKRKKKG